MAKLSEYSAYAAVGVKDIEAARTFYGETLGLTVFDDGFGGILFDTGQSKLFVYESAFAGTNQATSVTWMVDDVAGVVDELKTAGVNFETYPDMPGEWQGDILVMDGMSSAWFKDPSGNILNVGSRE